MLIVLFLLLDTSNVENSLDLICKSHKTRSCDYLFILIYTLASIDYGGHFAAVTLHYLECIFDVREKSKILKFESISNNNIGQVVKAIAANYLVESLNVVLSNLFMDVTSDLHDFRCKSFLN